MSDRTDSAVLPILLDATSIPPNKGGVARYLAGLLSGLTDAGARIHVVVKAEDLAWLSPQAPDHEYVTAPGIASSRPLRFLWEQLGLPLLAQRLGATTLHSPHYTFPLAFTGRRVVTVHDATFFSRPADHSPLKRAFFTSWMRLARRLADVIVTPSRATADEMERFAGRARATRVALHGVDPDVFHLPSHDEVTRFARRLDASTADGWIAFLGTVEPRKNVTALIRAHERARSIDTAVPPLLVAGGLGWDDEAAALLTAAGNTPGAPVRYLGYLDLDDLAAFLGGASFVVYPSSAEGFGLPVLEAMSTGGAVLTAPRLAIPEVGGDAVDYAEPTVDGIEQGILRLVQDPARRRELSGLGSDRARLFTWKACADEHLRAYERPDKAKGATP
ncbi:glycosyltransferase family 4 protein [Frondihabitans sp. VKM Ac-2883]|uniref:glycosyltransferase family 4 protein n=1 Tax=Frondihabitans sp. VKM Ac-2883 TaxID=2783823 RepID=UPI00351C3D33